MKDDYFFYSIPMAFFPVDSKPPLVESLPREILRPVISFRVSAQKVCQLITEHLLSQTTLSGCLKIMDTLLTQVETALQPEIEGLAINNTYETSERVLQEVLAAVDEECFTGYAIYDRYFQVIRVKDMTGREFLAQLTRTCRSVLLDLPFVLLNREELYVLIDTMRMLFTFPGDPQTAEEENPPDADLLALPPVEPSNLATWWPQTVKELSQEHNERIALYRWIVGHHLFDLYAMISGAYLARATDDFSDSQTQAEAPQNLHIASRFLRGTTAAMWYAGDMPARIYQDFIRPSMIKTETPNGFSGDQNADYARMKENKDRLKTLLVTQYGTHLELLPHRIKEAVKEFVEVYIHDNEHHTLIASAKVGRDASLVQKIWQTNISDSLKQKNAVELLREMTRLRQEEFNF